MNVCVRTTAGHLRLCVHVSLIEDLCSSAYAWSYTVLLKLDKILTVNSIKPYPFRTCIYIQTSFQFLGAIMNKVICFRVGSHDDVRRCNWWPKMTKIKSKGIFPKVYYTWHTIWSVSWQDRLVAQNLMAWWSSATQNLNTLKQVTSCSSVLVAVSCCVSHSHTSLRYPPDI